jgi:hypothetical protein
MIFHREGGRVNTLYGLVLREPNRFAHLFAIILREHNPCHSCLRLTRAKPPNALMGLFHVNEILTRNNSYRFLHIRKHYSLVKENVYGVRF